MVSSPSGTSKRSFPNGRAQEANWRLSNTWVSARISVDKLTNNVLKLV